MSDIQTRQLLVLKRIRKAKIDFDTLWAELASLQRLQPICRENLVCFDRFLEDEDAYYITTRYLGRHMIDMFRLIHDPNRSIRGWLQGTIANNLLRSLGAIHARGVAHRDIKPSNILVDPSTGDVRFIDFGLACWEGQCERDFTTGTINYSAPELRRAGIENGHAAPLWTLERFQKADVYAIGAVILELMTREVLPANATLAETRRDILAHREDLIQNGGPDLLPLMNPDPNARPILAHKP